MENLEELLASRAGNRLLDGTLGLSLGSEELLSAEGLGVRVESEEDSLVSERVLLLGEGPLLDGLTGGSDDRLDLVRVDETGDVGSRDLGGGEVEARLLLVDRVEGSNGRLGPDDESTNVTTRGELEEVEGLDGAGLDTGDVLESPDDTLVLGVNDEGTPPLPVPPVPHLTLTGPDLPRVGNLGDVGVGSDSLEELDGSLGLLSGLDGRREDEGDLLDLLDPVASGEDKGGESRGSEGRSNGVSSLVLVHLDVPLPPGLGRGEHSTTSAHVTERGLAGSLGTTTANTGDTRNGTTGTPRLGRGLVTGILSNGVSLSTVLGDRLVDLLDDVEPDGGGEDGGEGERARGLAGGRPDGDGGTSSHFDVLECRTLDGWERR